MTPRCAPPRLAAWLLRVATPSEDLSYVLADLAEEFDGRGARDGPASARRWYWRQAVTSLLPLLRRRMSRGPGPARPGPFHGWMIGLKTEFRGAWVSWVRTPWSLGAATLLLVAGIGLTTLAFAVVNGLLLLPLPFHDPGRLVAVSFTTEEGRRLGLTYPDYLDWSRSTRVFERMGAYDETRGTLRLPSGAERVNGGEISHDLFPTLGLAPMRGRGFSVDDDLPGAQPVILLGHALWVRHFGADSSVVGKAVSMFNRSYTVVGIMPSDVQFPGEAEFWIPMGQDDALNDRENYDVRVLGRLSAGRTLIDAQQDAEARRAELADRFVSKQSLGVVAFPMRDIFGNRESRPAALAVFVLTAIVFLICCGNVAVLVLLRWVRRDKEFAVRRALGATRVRISRQLLTEGLTVAVPATFFGMGFAVFGHRVLLDLVPASLLETSTTVWDPRVMFFVAGLALLAVLAAGLAPVFIAHRGQGPGETLTVRQTGGGGVHAQRLRHALVIGEVAATVVLLAGAGVFLQALRALDGIDPGFAPAGLAGVTYQLDGPAWAERRVRSEFADLIVSRVRAVPGVDDAAGTVRVPGAGRSLETAFEIEGQAAGNAPQPTALFTAVTPEYFRTMGIPILAGTDFESTRADDRGEGPAIVSAAMAELAWPGQSAIGRRLRLASPGARATTEDDRWLRVVGIVGNVRHESVVGDMGPGVYLPYRDWPAWYLTVVVRSNRTAGSVISELRRVIRGIDPSVPVVRESTMDGLIAETLWRPRLLSQAFSWFAVVGLLLAGVGVYGAAAAVAAQRRQEIGIRLALGARWADIVYLVGITGARVTGIGVLMGLMGAVVLGRLVRGFFVGVAGLDIPVLVGAILLMILLGLSASLVAAGRAVRIDPVVALRLE